MAVVPVSQEEDQRPTPPKDSFHAACIIHFILGAGTLLPWNAFVTAIDYFSYLYPSSHVNRVFALAYLASFLVPMSLIVGAHKSRTALRINAGLVLFTASLLVVPVMDAAYVKGRKGMHRAYDVTVGAVVVAGMADARVRSGIIGSAGELPKQYMQAVAAGTAASGVLVSSLRVVTKAIFPRDAHGLRESTNLCFGVGIAAMAICLACYNIASKLPIVQYYKEIKMQALQEERNENVSLMIGSSRRSTLWDIVKRAKCFCFGMFIVYLVTLSIYPGFLTEDVHSKVLKDWYPIILIVGYSVFDLAGKILPAVYLLQNANVAVVSCVARLLFYPAFLGCLHGPKFLRREIPITALTCLLGLTNGYFASVLMILAPKSVPIQHAEPVGILTVFLFVVGSVVGSLVSWAI